MLFGEEDKAAAGSEALAFGSCGNQGIGSAAGARQFEQQLAAYWPAGAWCGTHVVLAVSGGADSVALLRAMVALKEAGGGEGKLYVAHLNHGMRGEEADADAEWLAALCERLALPLEISKVDISSLAADQGDGWEAAARTARYDFLLRTAEKIGARFVATAHTSDDQVETVLQRIVRGTGLAGLAGIPSRRPLSKSVVLVRPMLALRRSDVLNYLASIAQDYRTDASNTDARFTRNRLRQELLPCLRERFNHDVDAALLRLATQADETQQLLENLAAEIAGECVVIEVDPQSAAASCEQPPARRVRIDCARLAGQPAIVIRELCKAAWRDAQWPLQSMGFHEWQLLAAMACGDCLILHANLPSNIGVCREGRHLTLEFRGLA